ncbi:hypothetical protein Ancab_029519 [Ancistrocladus abbreviatus]
MASRRNVHYSPLPTDEDDGYYDDHDDIKRKYDPRFDYTPRALDRVPWKSIALALFLLFLGSLLFFLSFFILTGHMGGEPSQAYGLMALGVLTFLPVSVINFLVMLTPMWELLIQGEEGQMQKGNIILELNLDFMSQGLLIIHGGVPKAIALLPSRTTEASASM